VDEPGLRTVEKVRPPFALGQFPSETVTNVAARIVYLLHTRGEACLEGRDWEHIFTDSIGADWTPSNIGLDDVRLGGCCWGAKTVKATKPAAVSRDREQDSRYTGCQASEVRDYRGARPGLNDLAGL
jgi:hypothetical protein